MWTFLGKVEFGGFEAKSRQKTPMKESTFRISWTKVYPRRNITYKIPKGPTQASCHTSHKIIEIKISNEQSYIVKEFDKVEVQHSLNKRFLTSRGSGWDIAYTPHTNVWKMKERKTSKSISVLGIRGLTNLLVPRNQLAMNMGGKSIEPYISETM